MIMGLLTGKTAVITGGSTGIGLATAKRFVEEGAYVFINGRSQAELDAAVKEIGENFTGVLGDGSKQGDRDRLYAAVADTGRRLDIVFAGTNNLVEVIGGRPPVPVEQYAAAARASFEYYGQYATWASVTDELRDARSLATS